MSREIERVEASLRRILGYPIGDESMGLGDLLEAVERQIEQGPLGVGDRLDGFCEGWFGRDSYGPKFVEGVGVDWVVVREDDGIVRLAWDRPANARRELLRHASRDR